jgi:hypothetical protein
MSEFKSTATADGANLTLAFQGTIDEDVEFPVVEAGKHPTITLDLKGIKAINSVGIREWLNWIRPLAETSKFILEHCPKAMVFQFNMVEGFLPPQARVNSFFVPFYSESADQEENVLFKVGQEVTATGGVIAINYDPKAAQLGGVDDMEMDVTEGKYFQFLKRAT